ncbi:flagellar protein FlgN [Pusillimonas sp. CC-YST705]|uniref:Flagellar protein FlgN n=1 Tax=Mesopusillimonas faecipullorum TaxID=2755040 RepID=A0ABS8C9V2_9BURK|nr:flagellar protein FlgN [Mesopusillimonas faecipullorum]MCB5362810.1 flagellar protein FlgN [Mesopusillimonas faecipullorum]
MSSVLQTLETCLDRQLTLAREFLTAVQHESQLLQDPSQAELLATSTATKLSCIQRFEALENVRNQALLQLDLDASPEGLQQALRLHPSLAPLFTELQDIADQARQLNEQNGTVIQTYLRHTQHTLADLRQLTGQATEPLYNASGRASGALPAGRTHITAG